MKEFTKLHQLGWNRRVLNFDDFEQACERAGILLLEARLRGRPGFYVEHRGWPMIGLDDRLRGPWRTLIAWHEYAHAIWHCPGHFGLHSKTETEANIVAYCALIPAPLLHLPDGEIAEHYGYPARLIAERVRIFRAFNL